MGTMRNGASALLFACGIVLTLAGLTSALGFTVGGVLASVAAVAALLYAGGAWFRAPAVLLAPAGADTIIVFDRSLRAASGAAPGVPVPEQFPPEMRSQIEAHCCAALRGDHTQFSCGHGSVRYAFEAAPVQTTNGVVVYAVLIAGTGIYSRRPAAAPVTTTA